MNTRFAKTPEPPYYVVVFASQRAGADEDYDATAAAMFRLAQDQPGFLGAESARDASGFGITVVYFADEAAIKAWKENAQHLAAQKLGRERWYARYTVKVAKVERAYSGP